MYPSQSVIKYASLCFPETEQAAFFDYNQATQLLSPANSVQQLTPIKKVGAAVAFMATLLIINEHNKGHHDGLNADESQTSFACETIKDEAKNLNLYQLVETLNILSLSELPYKTLKNPIGAVLAGILANKEQLDIRGGLLTVESYARLCSKDKRFYLERVADELVKANDYGVKRLNTAGISRLANAMADLRIYNNKILTALIKRAGSRTSDNETVGDDRNIVALARACRFSGSQENFKKVLELTDIIPVRSMSAGPLLDEIERSQTNNPALENKLVDIIIQDTENPPLILLSAVNSIIRRAPVDSEKLQNCLNKLLSESEAGNRYALLIYYKANDKIAKRSDITDIEPAEKEKFKQDLWLLLEIKDLLINSGHISFLSTLLNYEHAEPQQKDEYYAWAEKQIDKLTVIDCIYIYKNHAYSEGNSLNSIPEIVKKAHDCLEEIPASSRIKFLHNLACADLVTDHPDTRKSLEFLKRDLLTAINNDSITCSEFARFCSVLAWGKAAITEKEKIAIGTYYEKNFNSFDDEQRINASLDLVTLNYRSDTNLRFIRSKLLHSISNEDTSKVRLYVNALVLNGHSDIGFTNQLHEVFKSTPTDPAVAAELLYYYGTIRICPQELRSALVEAYMHAIEVLDYRSLTHGIYGIAMFDFSTAKEVFATHKPKFAEILEPHFNRSLLFLDHLFTGNSTRNIDKSDDKPTDEHIMRVAEERLTQQINSNQSPSFTLVRPERDELKPFFKADLALRNEETSELIYIRLAQPTKFVNHDPRQGVLGRLALQSRYCNDNMGNNMLFLPTGLLAGTLSENCLKLIERSINTLLSSDRKQTLIVGYH